MARTIRGATFVERFVTMSPGEHYIDCRFTDCIVVGVGQGSGEVTRVVFDRCTFVGMTIRDHPGFRRDMQAMAVKAHEPEVLSARIGALMKKAERSSALMTKFMIPTKDDPAPRQRRSFFNWRKRD